VKREYQQDATIQTFIVNFRCLLSTAVTVTFTVPAPYNAKPHNSNQPHPALPAQTPYAVIQVFVFLMMGIMMPETC